MTHTFSIYPTATVLSMVTLPVELSIETWVTAVGEPLPQVVAIKTPHVIDPQSVKVSKGSASIKKSV